MSGTHLNVIIVVFELIRGPMIETRVDLNLERSGCHLSIKWNFRKFSPNAPRNSDFSYYIQI